MPVRAYIDAMRGLGERAAGRGLRAEALEYAAKVRRLTDADSTLQPLLAGRALAAAGSIHAKLGDRESARNLLRRSLEVFTGIETEPGREPGKGLREQIRRVTGNLERI